MSPEEVLDAVEKWLCDTGLARLRPHSYDEWVQFRNSITKLHTNMIKRCDFHTYKGRTVSPTVMGLGGDCDICKAIKGTRKEIEPQPFPLEEIDMNEFYHLLSGSSDDAIIKVAEKLNEIISNLNHVAKD